MSQKTPPAGSPVLLDEVLLSVLIPCYNEESTVERVVDAVRAIPIAVEIIGVDDGSTDGTLALLRQMETAGRIDHLEVHPHNRGKGAAIHTALEVTSGDIVIVQDADLEYDPQDIPLLLQPILEGKADAVFGSRFRGGQPRRTLYFWHYVGNHLITLFSNVMTNLNLTDVETGYKAIRGDLARSLRLKSNRFGFEPEITARLAKARARIYERGISYAGRTYAEGKKINWKDGIAALWHILRFNLERDIPSGAAAHLAPFAALVEARKKRHTVEAE